MKPAFKSLYHLENGTHHILEIKRTDLESDADVSDIYKWMFIDKTSLNIHQLWFSSMDSSGNIEERFFDQGYLKFNESEGTFIEKFNSAQHQLVNKGKDRLPVPLISAIEKYLSDLQ